MLFLQLVYLGVSVYAPALALSAVIPIKLRWAIGLTSIICTAYTAMVRWLPNSLTLNLLKAASHRIRLRLTIRLMANGSLHTGSVGHTRVNFSVSTGFELT